MTWRTKNRRRWKNGARTWRPGARMSAEPSPAASRCLRSTASLQPVIAQYHLPFTHFDELIRGVEMDLDIKRYQTIELLEDYCYRVASVVGLLSIEIFGYRNGACRAYAVHLGKALQLTNILRDVRADAARGRIYLPLSELERHKVAPEEILRFEYSDRFERLAESAAAQARRYYTLARQTLPAEDRRAMIAAELMGSVYWRLLRQLERQRFNVFGPVPARVSRGQKVLLIFRVAPAVFRRGGGELWDGLSRLKTEKLT